MAMSKCRECDKAVSTLAKTCPSCGVPKPAKVLKKKTSTKKTTSTAKKINKNKEGIWAHCINYQCRDYTQMYKIPKSALNFEKCKLCGSMFWEPKTVNGKPVMPSDGIYDKIQKRNPISQGIVDFKRGFNTTPEEIDEMNAQTENSSTTQTTSGQKDDFQKFIDGEMDLATSFWGFLIVGTFIVGFVSGFLSPMIGSWIIIALGIYTWIAVQGTWASAEKYKAVQTKKKQSIVWGILAQIVCGLNIISTIGLLFETFS
ncbi:hypothetical protein N8805_00995 [Candidatus Pelagibacter ubique]|nr:hypothetical protein [Candidatus Pelagibacter ubique]